jgi:hypothetical protein
MSRLAETDAAAQLWIARMQLSVNNPEGAAKNLSAALTRRPDYPEVSGFGARRVHSKVERLLTETPLAAGAFRFLWCLTGCSVAGT